MKVTIPVKVQVALRDHEGNILLDDQGEVLETIETRIYVYDLTFDEVKT